MNAPAPISLDQPTAPATSTSVATPFFTHAQQLAQHTQDGKRDLLMIQARCNVAGHTLEEEFSRLTQLIQKYESLLKQLSPATSHMQSGSPQAEG